MKFVIFGYFWDGGLRESKAGLLNCSGEMYPFTGIIDMDTMGNFAGWLEDEYGISRIQGRLIESEKTLEFLKSYEPGSQGAKKPIQFKFIMPSFLQTRGPATQMIRKGWKGNYVFEKEDGTPKRGGAICSIFDGHEILFP